MRYKILLDGEQVRGDDRGWYAILEQSHTESLGDVWHADVYHPKDHPDNDPPFVNCISADKSMGSALGFVVADGWLRDVPIEQLMARCQPF